MNMKFSKYIIGACLASLLSVQTSCIREVLPTDAMTEDQLNSSQKALEARMWSIVAFVNNYGTTGSGDWHADFGYSSIMHIRDLMTEDMAIAQGYSGHWASYHTCQALGKTTTYPAYIWLYYYKFIQNSNLLIRSIDEATANNAEKGYLAVGHAFRAMQYLELAQMVEFLPNDKFQRNSENNDVTHLTVPIVTEKTTKEQANNNPRATREEMVEFINADLDKALELIDYLEYPDKTLPHEDVIHGLRARLYLWIEDYPQAQLYARKAIDASNSVPMTQDECLSTTNGFNTADPWMWAGRMVKENSVVQTGIVNWTSWMCNEALYGYAGAAAINMISSALYNEMANTDFRKYMFKASDSSPIYNKSRYINKSVFERLPQYASLKFRPAGGNTTDPLTASASAFPMMRVEEMYFIEAEAAAHQSESEGQKLLIEFMRKYRDKNYIISGKRNMVEEILLQKRIELWGEGITFFDVKRLGLRVTRGYQGSNFIQTAMLNTDGRPAWMNFCIPQSEENNNKAIMGYNNPDPSSKYQPWTGR